MTRSPSFVAVVVLLASATFVLTHLVRTDFNPTVFIAIGDESGAIREYAESTLDDVILRPQFGHDGRFFFVQGTDPWMRNAESTVEMFDRPGYRVQRMAFPTLASLGGLLPPEGVVWGMVLVNLLAMSWGAYSCSAITRRLGGSVWWGLAFPLNVGLLSELVIGGAGILAAAAAFAAVWSLMNDRPVTAGAMFAISSLSREVMLIAVIGAFVWLVVSGNRRKAVIVLVPSLISVFAWGAYVSTRLQDASYVTEGALGFPFLGLLKAFPDWFTIPLDLVVGLSSIAVLVAYTYRAVVNPSLLAWTFLPFSLLAVFLGELVWEHFFNIARAIAPMLTAYFLITFAPSPGEQERLGRDSPLKSRRSGQETTISARG